nr:MAG TPA: TFIIB zinc-binding [Caudoviricetes sp.]DAR19290.1 MAG TPA: TFIIB zinc-binding [Caudoviricetes sp.]
MQCPTCALCLVSGLTAGKTAYGTYHQWQM